MESTAMLSAFPAPQMYQITVKVSLLMKHGDITL